MAQSCNFEGHLKFDVPLTHEQIAYIQKFTSTRRVKRDEIKAAKLDDPLRQAIFLPIGIDGEYYVGTEEDCEESRDESVTDYDCPPSSQPEVFCMWVISNDGSKLELNGSVDVSGFVEWLWYMIDNFFNLWQKTLTGTITWDAENTDDSGYMQVINNDVDVAYNKNLIY